jgi:SulP family sulfate permease
MDAALDFGSADTFENAVIERLTRAPETRHVVLFAQPINRIDATGVEMFARLRATLAKRGLLLSVVGLKLPVETVLRRAGELEEGPFLKIYPTEAEILKILDESTLSQSP